MHAVDLGRVRVAARGKMATDNQIQKRGWQVDVFCENLYVLLMSC